MYLRRKPYSVSGACRVRAEAVPGLRGGRSELYRTLELPGANPLKNAHAALDAAVLAAYGFHPAKDLIAQVLALNQYVAASIKSDRSITAPGLPADAKSRTDLITADCINPS